MQLAYRSEAAANAVEECEAAREELAEVTKKYEEERKTSMDVTRSMTRQFKGMQDELLNKINERERMIESLRDDIETWKVTHREKMAEKDGIIQQKDADAEKQRLDTQKMCEHFARLLSITRLKIVNYTRGGDGAVEND